MPEGTNVVQNEILPGRKKRKMTSRSELVGFVGLGSMGFELASRMASLKIAIQIHDLDSGRISDFISRHPRCTTASHSSWHLTTVLFLSLPNSDSVDSFLKGNEGVVHLLPKNALIVDLGSSDPIRSAQLSEYLNKLGLRYVDAPVSGGVAGGRNGSLTSMVGGSATDFDEARKFLEAFSSQIFHVGPAGNGHAAKALNNLVSGTSLAVTLEALSVASTFGIDVSVMNSVLNSSSGRTNSSEKKIEQFVVSEKYDSGFALALMAKDMRMAIRLAESLGIAVPISSTSERLWAAAAIEGPTTLDHTEIARSILGRLPLEPVKTLAREKKVRHESK